MPDTPAPCNAKPKRPPRRATSAADHAADTAAGIIAESIERDFADGELGRLLGARHDDPRVRDLAHELFARIQRRVASHVYEGEPPDTSGIIRKRRPDRVAGLKAFAARLKREADRGRGAGRDDPAA